MKLLLKFISIVLCLSFLTSLSLNVLADDLSLEIIEIYTDDDTVFVTCRKSGTITSNLTLICKGEDNSILYINDYSPVNYDLFELTFPIEQNSDTQEFTVSIGGRDLASPVSQSFYLSDTQPAEHFIFQPNQTVSQLRDEFNNNNAKFIRNGQTLADDDIVNSNDEMVLYCNTGNLSFNVLILGDANLDGQVDFYDVLVILQYTVGKITLTGPSLQVANVEQADEVSMSSALLVLQLNVLKIEKF